MVCSYRTRSAMLLLLLLFIIHIQYGEGIVFLFFFFQIKTHWRQAWGNAIRLGVFPPIRTRHPIEAAIPTHIVYTSAGTACIVSWIAIPDITPPPREFINKCWFLVWSSRLRHTMRPTMVFEISSSISWHKKSNLSRWSRLIRTKLYPFPLGTVRAPLDAYGSKKNCEKRINVSIPVLFLFFCNRFLFF